jgi:hypothetical protein
LHNLHTILDQQILVVIGEGFVPVCVILAAAPELENVIVEPETVVVAITRLLSAASRGR